MIVTAVPDECVKRRPVRPAELAKAARTSDDPRSRAARIRLQRVLSNGSWGMLPRFYQKNHYWTPLALVTLI